MLSDHTLGWAKFSNKALFRNTAYTPAAGEARQFTLSNLEKKRQYKEKLSDIHKHQSIPQKVFELEKAFEAEGKATSELKARFQTLDKEIEESMIASANAVGRKDYGYQRSADLIEAL